MPSPTSMTVPTSDTCTFCSKLAISRFRTLLISATLIAIGSPIGSLIQSHNPSSFRCGREQLFLHRAQLISHRGVNELVADTDDHPADDVFVFVLVNDNFALHRAAEKL